MRGSRLLLLLETPGFASLAATRRGAIAHLTAGLLALGLGQMTVTSSKARKRKGRKGKKRHKNKNRNPGTSQNNPSGSGNPTGGSGTNPAPPPPPPPGPGSDGLDAEESTFLTLINNYRAAKGKSALSHNAQLGAAAAAHSEDMATHSFGGHTGSDGSTEVQRIERAGYDWSWWGENVFWGDASAQGAFNWWKNSTRHNDNMLSPNVTEIGIARAYNAASTYDWYWTTDFGHPG